MAPRSFSRTRRARMPRKWPTWSFASSEESRYMSGGPKEPSPDTTLVILLGASEWPMCLEFQSDPAFARSAVAVKNYFSDPRGFGLPWFNLLDLFDTNKSADDIDRDISDFLVQRTSQMKQAGNDAQDLILYFIGHGGFVGATFDYCLAIRRSRSDSLRVSSIEMAGLADTLKHRARHMRRVLILDCCFAGAAFSAFQSDPAAVAIAKATDVFKVEGARQGADHPTQGTSLLCSSGQRVPSLLMPDRSGTMFSTALVRALTQGKPGALPRLSLDMVADLTASALDDLQVDNAPRPELHSPDQREGRVEHVPLFP